MAAALRALAEQTDTEIVSLEPGLAKVRVPARHVRGDAAQSLDEILDGTAYRAVRIGANSFRIVRKPVAPHPQRVRPVESGTGAEIVVTASKFPVPLLHYPGSVVQAGRPDAEQPASRTDNMDDVARRLPILQHTDLGEGRNKIFIRGLADSSFNGATQPTASIYFGDALLAFGSPTPGLELHDVAGIEVLEGPQGTLYGSGSMGGVIHITPNPVDYEHISGSATLGGSATVHGDPGWDTSAMLNLPIVQSRIGVRAVAYHELDGGYIDNVPLGHDSNAVNVSGGRAAVSALVGDTITINTGFLYQETDGRDAQYADAGVGPLARKAHIAEPYASSLGLGYVSLEQRWDSGLKLSMVTSYGTRSSFDTFDSTPGGPGPGQPPVAYQLSRSSLMFAQETRLSRQSDKGLSWVIGATYQRVRDGQVRALGIPDQPTDLDEVTNITYSASLFGQARLALGQSLEATLGARWTTARTDSDPSLDRSVPIVRGIVARRVDPTVALAWTVAPRTLLYTRLQTGYRNGGMAVARGIGRVADFQSDSVIMGEVGARWLRNGTRGLSASMALSYTGWDDIQGDLISRRGLPYTANIGDARVFAVEGTADWVPVAGLTFGGSFFFTDNRLSGPLADQVPPSDRRLPETPRWAGAVRADYDWGDVRRIRYRAGMAAHYVGRSILGPGALLDVSQGDYSVVDIHGGARRGAVDLSVSIDNLFNTHANRFAFGNPISFYNHDQNVPLQPLTGRVAIGFSW